MARSLSRELGSYLLEFAGVTLGLVILVIGGSDIVKILQARTAIRAAVNDGLRCLYPTDASCASNQSRWPLGPLRTFDVWVWGSGYRIPQETYVANARWSTEPVYETDIMSGKLTKIEFSQEPYQYEMRDVLYPSTAHAPYFVQTSPLPVVSGGTPLAPRFSDPFTGKDVRPQRIMPLASVRGSTAVVPPANTNDLYRPEFKIGSVSFPVSGAWPSMSEDLGSISKIPMREREKVPCYVGGGRALRAGAALDWEKGPPDTCSYRGQDGAGVKLVDKGAPRVPLMLRITGSPAGSHLDGEGKVLISLSWRGPSSKPSKVRLGGRIITNDSSGNFIPRGLAREEIGADVLPLYAPYESELTLYRELPLVPVDATVTIDFYLVSSNGRSVAWRGGSLEVFYPKFRFVHESFECGHSPNPDFCAHPPMNTPFQYVSLSSVASIITRKSGQDYCARERRSDAEPDVHAVVQALEGAAHRGENLAPRSFVVPVATDHETCTFIQRSERCSVSVPSYPKGCDVPLSPDQLAALCGISGPDIERAREIRATVENSFDHATRVRGCSDDPLPPCAIPHARVVGSSPLFSDDACNLRQEMGTPQFVLGPLHENVCEDRISEVQRLYRTTHKVPNGVAISVVRLPASPAFSAQPPTGQCVPHESARGSSQEMVCGQGISERAAEACCAASEGRCRKRHVVRSDDREYDGTEELILSAARQRVIEGVQAAYPPARYQPVCSDSEADCLEVKTEWTEGDAKAQISARMRVALSLLKPLEHSVWSVEYSTSRQLERVALQ